MLQACKQKINANMQKDIDYDKMTDDEREVSVLRLISISLLTLLCIALILSLTSVVTEHGRARTIDQSSPCVEGDW